MAAGVATMTGWLMVAQGPPKEQRLRVRYRRDLSTMSVMGPRDLSPLSTMWP